jgi:hypothetical protein
MIEFHQAQRCFFDNKIEPVHVAVNHDHHRKANNTSKEMLHVHYVHVFYKG